MLLNMMRAVKVAVIIILPIAILFGLGLLLSRPSNDDVQEPASIARGESKSDNDGGDVTVMADFVERSGKLVFNVYIDTHTVDLSYFNPRGQVSLEGNDGAMVAPERAESSGSEHHLEFTLYFPKVEGSVRLVVRDLAGVPRREIIWPR